MNVKEIQPGVLVVGQSRIAMPIIGAILGIVGIILFISNMANFDASNGASWIGLVLLVIGALMIVFWKSKKTTLDKNQNKMTYELKSIFKKNQKQYDLNEIQEIGYQESIRRSTTSDGTKTTVTKIVKLTINNGETYDLLVTQGNYNPFVNRTKERAQKIADFLGLPLKSLSVGDALNEIKNVITNNRR